MNDLTMDIFSSYNLIIEASVILILSFLFNTVAKRTNIPSVLLLILLGVVLQFVLKTFTAEDFNFLPALEVLGIIGLIMIVLEADRLGLGGCPDPASVYSGNEHAEGLDLRHTAVYTFQRHNYS